MAKRPYWDNGARNMRRGFSQSSSLVTSILRSRLAPCFWFILDATFAAIILTLNSLGVRYVLTTH